MEKLYQTQPRISKYREMLMPSLRARLFLVSLGVISVCVLFFAMLKTGRLSFGKRVLASGSLEIYFQNTPLSGPVFQVENFLPLDCSRQTIEVKNTSQFTKSVAVKAVSLTQTNNLSSVINLTVFKDEIAVYGSEEPPNHKTLAQFVTESG